MRDAGIRLLSLTSRQPQSKNREARNSALNPEPGKRLTRLGTFRFQSRKLARAKRCPVVTAFEIMPVLAMAMLVVLIPVVGDNPMCLAPRRKDREL